MSCPMMLPAVQVPGVFPPPTRYERAVSTYNLLGLRSTGCGGGGSTTSRILYVIDRSGDSGLRRTKH